MALTLEQQSAVQRTGQDVCVLAGPGSGKTSVLTERFAWLVENWSVSPRNILAITFTEKSAAEIRHRVSQRLQGLADPVDIELAPISTMHSLCTRILKEFAIPAGLDPGFDLWDERQASASLFASAEHVLNCAARAEKSALRRLFLTWNSSDMINDLCKVHNKIRSYSETFPLGAIDADPERTLADMIAFANDVAASQGSTDNSKKWHAAFCDWWRQARPKLARPDWDAIAAIAQMPKQGSLPGALKAVAAPLYQLAQTAPAHLVSHCVAEERAYLLAILQRVSAEYTHRKTLAARIDFQDLEHRAIRLLRANAGVREELQRRYEHLLIDEMQDTNAVQWTLIDLLRSPGSLFAVGDINQSIYSFRFAAPEQFIAYRDSLAANGASIDLLLRNFRSRESILAFTDQVCEKLPGIEHRSLQPGRAFQSDHLSVSLHPYEEHREEHAWIADEILNLRDNFVVEPKGAAAPRALRLSDVAILVRKSNTGEHIAAALAEAGIPSVMSGGRAFFNAQEVIDLINYLAVLANPTDGIALAAVLRSPFFGWSDDDLLNHRPLPAFPQRALIDEASPELFLVQALDASGYCDSLAPEQKANVDKFLRIVRDEWQASPRPLRAFLDELSAMRVASAEKSAPQPDAEDAVHILTVHASKGLEFPVVFLAGAAATATAPPASIDYDPEIGIGIRWSHPATGKPLPDFEAHEIAARAKVIRGAESDRMLYVGLTRAEQRLYVSWASKKQRRSGWLKAIDPHRGFLFPVEAGRELTPEPQPPTPTIPRVDLYPLDPRPPGISTTTPTDLATYARCPRRYFLDRLAGLQPPAPSAAIELGNAVHAILAGQQPAMPSEEAEALAAVFRDSDLARRAEVAVWLEHEFDVVFEVDGLVVEGQLDLCFEESDGTLVIVDYKTDAKPSNGYAIQLALYREALAKLFPNNPICSYLFFVRANEVIESTAPLDRTLLHRFQNGSDFEVRPGNHCQRCPHMGAACPVTP